MQINLRELQGRIYKKFARIVFRTYRFIHCFIEAGFKFALLDYQEFVPTERMEFKKIEKLLKEKFEILCQKPEDKQLLEHLLGGGLDKENCRRILQEQLGNLNMLQLVTIYKYLSYFSSFLSAYFLRDALLRAKCKESSKTMFVSRSHINAALEIGSFDLVKTLLDRPTSYLLPRRYRFELRAFLLLINGKNKEAQKIWRRFYNSEDLKFSFFLENKRVAIVGPAPPTDPCGEEIDSNEIVVRTNYRKGSNEPAKSFGRHTNVSYYNHFRVAQKLEEIVSVASELNWIILKSRFDLTRVKKAIKASHSVLFRNAFLSHAFFFPESSPMGIQTIIGDLIRFNSRKIKLYCTNFYLSSETYSASYRVEPMTKKGVSESLRVHELFSCFRFTQHLYRSGVIDCDAITSKVLGMEAENYAREIDKIYGKVNVLSDMPNYDPIFESSSLVATASEIGHN